MSFAEKYYLGGNTFFVTYDEGRIKLGGYPAVFYRNDCNFRDVSAGDFRFHAAFDFWSLHSGHHSGKRRVVPAAVLSSVSGIFWMRCACRCSDRSKGDQGLFGAFPCADNLCHPWNDDRFFLCNRDGTDYAGNSTADAAVGELSCDCLSGGRCAGTGDAVGKGKAGWLISLPL